MIQPAHSKAATTSSYATPVFGRTDKIDFANHLTGN